MTGHVRRRGERSWETKFDFPADPAHGQEAHSFQTGGTVVFE
jgi:hypothetical protein